MIKDVIVHLNQGRGVPHKKQEVIEMRDYTDDQMDYLCDVVNC